MKFYFLSHGVNALRYNKNPSQCKQSYDPSNIVIMSDSISNDDTVQMRFPAQVLPNVDNSATN